MSEIELDRTDAAAIDLKKAKDGLANTDGSDDVLADLYKISGNLANQLKNLDQAVAAYRKSIAYRIAFNDSSALSLDYSNLGIFYSRFLKKNDTALDYYQKGLALARAANDSASQILVLINMADLHITTKNTGSGTASHTKSIVHRRRQI